MIFLKKALLILNLLFVITAATSQSIDPTLKTNPLLELGINTKILGLMGNIKEMQEHKFATDAQGHTTNDSASVSYQYKFDKNGLTQEIEETFRNLLSKKSFFSYTNTNFVSHIDIETYPLSYDKDSTEVNIENPLENNLIFSTADYKYVQKKNILYKGEELIESLPQKTTTRKGYFYHFNDANQIFQIDYQTTDTSTQYNYGTNGLIKESLTSKSGTVLHKKTYKYDRNNRLVNLATFNSGNTTRIPNEEAIITYKLDTNGNAIEKKVKTYQYSKEGVKEFSQGSVFLYNYTYL
jgi:hypothetical protein